MKEYLGEPGDQDIIPDVSDPEKMVKSFDIIATRHLLDMGESPERVFRTLQSTWARKVRKYTETHGHTERGKRRVDEAVEQIGKNIAFIKSFPEVFKTLLDHHLEQRRIDFGKRIARRSLR